MTRVTMWLILTVVASAAAVLSFSALRDLAVLCGFSHQLAWLLPLVIDAGAAAGGLVWMSRPATDPDHRFARTLTWLLLAVSVTGNSIVHGLAAYRAGSPSWLVLMSAVMSSLAPLVLGSVIHLAIRLGQPSRTAAEATEEADCPAVLVDDEPDLAAELISSGAGRRRIARELGVSEHEARQLLASNGHHTNGQVR